MTEFHSVTTIDFRDAFSPYVFEIPLHPFNKVGIGAKITIITEASFKIIKFSLIIFTQLFKSFQLLLQRLLLYFYTCAHTHTHYKRESPERV